MYTPSKFKVEDPELIHTFIEENSFGLILSIDGAEIQDTHTPFVLSKDGKYLLGHIARANPQWKSWSNETAVKIIFTGAHSYISPQFYVSDFAVPTWNYTAVSVSGKLEFIKDDTEIIKFLDRLVEFNETTDNPWVFDSSDERYLALLTGIVCFSVSMDKVEASFKMNQNKSDDDQNKVINSLSASSCPMNQSVARIMHKNRQNK